MVFAEKMASWQLALLVRLQQFGRQSVNPWPKRRRQCMPNSSRRTTTTPSNGNLQPQRGVSRPKSANRAWQLQVVAPLRLLTMLAEFRAVEFGVCRANRLCTQKPLFDRICVQTGNLCASGEFSHRPGFAHKPPSCPQSLTAKMGLPIKSKVGEPLLAVDGISDSASPE